MVSNTLPGKGHERKALTGLECTSVDGLTLAGILVNTREDWAKALVDEFQHAASTNVAVVRLRQS
jgi:hypothetical protein